MNAYVEKVIAGVKERHGNEPEFVQTVEEVLSSLSPVIDRHPEYEKADLLTRMVEPERMFTFRVVWMMVHEQFMEGETTKRSRFEAPAPGVYVVKAIGPDWEKTRKIIAK